MRSEVRKSAHLRVDRLEPVAPARRAFHLVVESLVDLIVLEGSCFCDHSSQGVATSNHAAAPRGSNRSIGSR
jgi:hypothetical protein